MKNKLNIPKGTIYGMLTVIRELSPYVLPSGQKNRAFECKCECGNIKKIRLLHLKRGRIRSCGCIAGEKHNESYSKLYNKWRAMMSRTSKNATDSHRYYDRNITVCESWRNSFICFKEWALKNGYNDSLQLDRIDNSLGYYPDNCRFVTQIENMANRENTRIVKYHGVDIVFMELLRSKKLENHDKTVRNRLKRGWSVNDAFDKPIRQGNYK